MDSKLPVFVLVTAANCGSCVAFRRKWPEIKQRIQESNLVEIFEIQLPSMASNLVQLGYPKDLFRYVRWFPIMMLFPSEEWEKALAGNDVKLNGMIINGSLNDEGVAEPGEQTVAFTSDSLIQWIRGKTSKFSLTMEGSLDSSRARKSLYSRVGKSSHRYSKEKFGSSCGKLNIRPKNIF